VDAFPNKKYTNRGKYLMLEATPTFEQLINMFFTFLEHISEKQKDESPVLSHLMTHPFS